MRVRHGKELGKEGSDSSGFLVLAGNDDLMPLHSLTLVATNVSEWKI